MQEEDPDVLPEQPPALFLDAQWYRIILDEAQVIKNRSTQTARAMFDLHAKYRWSLSGTPMQNGVDEMFSQLCYLRIRPYHEWQKFHMTFVNGFRTPHSRKGAMKKFQTLLKAILLRRTKQSKIDGVEIIKGLPKKEIAIVHAEFDEEQLEFYRALEAGAVIELKRYRDAGTLGKNISRGLVLLLRLRQACLHPRLVTEAEKVKGGSAELTVEQQVLLAKEFTPQTVRRIQEITSFECPVCMDTFLNPTLVFPCGHHVFPYITSGRRDTNGTGSFARIVLRLVLIRKRKTHSLEEKSTMPKRRNVPIAGYVPTRLLQLTIRALWIQPEWCPSKHSVKPIPPKKKNNPGKPPTTTKAIVTSTLMTTGIGFSPTPASEKQITRTPRTRLRRNANLTRQI